MPPRSRRRASRRPQQSDGAVRSHSSASFGCLAEYSIGVELLRAVDDPYPVDAHRPQLGRPGGRCEPRSALRGAVSRGRSDQRLEFSHEAQDSVPWSA